MMSAKSKKRSPLAIIDALIAIAVVVVFATAAYQISDSAQGYSYDYDARDYLYAAEYNRFGELYETAIGDMDKDAKYSTEVSDCRALAFYYEQAVLEHAYRTIGDNAKASEFADRMGEYESQLGSMSGKTDAVRDAVEATSRHLTENESSSS